VYSSSGGLFFYDVAADKSEVLDNASSPFGLVPRFRTASQISYVRLRERGDPQHLYGQDSFFEFDLESSKSIELLRLPNHVMGYDWSPDGRRLAYQLRVEQADEVAPVALCMFDTDATTVSFLRPLNPPIGTGTGQREETAVTWSPGGRAILLVDTAESPSLQVVSEDGVNLIDARDATFGRWLGEERLIFQEDPHTDQVAAWRTLTTQSGATRAFKMPDRAYRPALSPDGSLIAFDDGDGDQPSIYIFDLATQTSRRLVRGYVAPVWLRSNLLAVSAAAPCSGGFCTVPWIARGGTMAVNVQTGERHSINLETTLQDLYRYGVIDLSGPPN